MAFLIRPFLALILMIPALANAKSYTYDSYRIWGLSNAARGEGIQSGDINLKGQVVGTYRQLDGAGVLHYHGYTLKDGQMTYPIDYQGATNTVLLAVNRSGTATGVTQVKNGTDTEPRIYGVVLDRLGFRLVDHPNAVYTALTAINDRGEIAGYYKDRGTQAVTGFIYRNGRFLDLKAQIPQLISVTGIDGRGRVSGVYAGFNAPFWSKNKQAELLTTPTGVYGPQGLAPWVFINNRGELAGSSSGSGFLWKAGSLRQIVIPGASSTVVEDLNQAGHLALTGSLGGLRQSFVYDRGQYFRLDVTDAAESRALGLNEARAVVGAYAVAPQGVFDRLYVAR